VLKESGAVVTGAGGLSKRPCVRQPGGAANVAGKEFK